ncbi:MAG: Gfo/Idh/MocA family oxidoreductase [Desulfobulbaceae bacterium]|nr:Gfo/Idh/MocA family oxidoreductase [Desulfobulbaceae bacterium]
MISLKKKWQVGVIGTGKHGSRYARHIVNDVEGLELAAVSRRSEEGQKQAEAWSCRWYGDWRQLVEAPEVECVVAAMPPVFNREIAAACVAAGKPLLLEKPMAVSVTEAAAINQSFCQQALPLTIGQTLRYNRVVRALRDQLASIGALQSFAVNLRLEPAMLDWLDDPALAGAGVSFHTAVHVFDALRFITGREIIRVMARVRCFRSAHLEDILLVLVELDNGAIGTVDCSKISPARSGRFEFVGETGQLHGDQVHHFCERIRGMERVSLDLEPPVSAIVPLLVDWLGWLRGTQANPVSGEEGLAAVRISEACLRSAAAGRWVEV